MPHHDFGAQIVGRNPPVTDYHQRLAASFCRLRLHRADLYVAPLAHLPKSIPRSIRLVVGRLESYLRYASHKTAMVNNHDDAGAKHERS